MYKNKEVEITLKNSRMWSDLSKSPHDRVPRVLSFQGTAASASVLLKTEVFK